MIEPPNRRTSFRGGFRIERLIDGHRQPVMKQQRLDHLDGRDAHGLRESLHGNGLTECNLRVGAGFPAHRLP